MNNLVTDPDRLRHRLAELGALKKSQRLPPDGIEAIAECCFRIAVHPATLPREALALLKRANKVDGVNPKYAYHIARLYFVHGDLERAAAWLETAIGLCPTSHRMWSHVSLLQRELNERFKGNDQFEPDDLRRQGLEVDRLVREGTDWFQRRLLQFEPRRSAQGEKRKPKDAPGARPDADAVPRPAKARPEFPEGIRRIHGRGRCRWSGVRDLAVEDLLRAETSEYMQAQLLLHMRFAARMAESRPRGVSAFAVLAIEWLVRGYPVEPVRRLRQSLTPGLVSHSLVLFDCVAGLCEESADGLSAALAEAVDRQALPPLLASMLHRRLLLASPVALREAARYRAARQFLADVERRPPAAADAEGRTAERAVALTHGIAQSLAALRARAADRKEDTPASPETPTPQEATRSIESCAHAADLLRRYRDRTAREMRRRLSGGPLGPEAAAQLSADRDGCKEIAQELGRVAEAASQRIDTVLTAAAADADGRLGLRDLLPHAQGVRRQLNRVLYVPSLAGILPAIDEALAGTRDLGAGSMATMSETLQATLTAIPSALPDESASESAPAHSPAERIIAINKQVQHVEQNLEQHWLTLRKLAVVRKSGELAQDDLRAAESVRDCIAHIDADREQALKDLHAAREAKPAPDQAALALLDETVGKLQNIQLGRFRSQLQKILPPTQAAAREAPAPPVEPAPSAQGAAETTASAARDAAPAAAEPTPVERSPVAALRDAVGELRQVIDDRLAQANATFDAYSPSARALPPIQALRLSTRARQAEVLYRMRRRREARALWSGMLREDRLDVNTLKNIAVADTYGQDVGRALASWRSYAELLYYYDVLAGSPRPHAGARAEFHRHYARAFAPACVVNPKKQADDRGAMWDLLEFVESPSRVRHFVGHVLLESFNAKFDFTSPPLILGIRRTDGEEARKRARESILTFTEQVRDLLPPRVRDAFADTVRGHVEAAVSACATPQRLTQDRDPSYLKEEPRHEEWLKAVCEVKFRLFAAMVSSEDLPKSISNVDFLEEVGKLDLIPIRTSAAFVEAEVRRYSEVMKGVDAAKMAALMDDGRARFLQGLLQFIFVGDNSGGDAALRKRQYQRLVETWVKRPALAEGDWLEIIDDPQPFYSPTIKAALLRHGSGPPEPAIAELLQWQAQYPELTGPARCAAILLANQGKRDEAIAVVERARKAGFSARGRQHCVDLLHQLGVQRDNEALEAGRFDQALPSLLARLEDDDGDTSLAETVIGAFLQLARQKKSVEGHGRVAQAVEGWITRAGARCAAASDTAGDPPLTPEDIDTIGKTLDQALVEAFLAPVGQLDDHADWSRVAQVMTQLLAVHPRNVDACYCRMGAWNQLAAQAVKAKDRARFRECCENALADARAVVERSATPEHRNQAEALRLQIEEALGKV